MMCPRCFHVSPQVDCRRCGFMPYVLQHQVGQDVQDVSTGTATVDKGVGTVAPGSANIPSVTPDLLPSVPNFPDLGLGGLGGTKPPNSGPDLVTIGKYAMIGGLVLGAGVVLYSVYKFWDAQIPSRALEHASRTQEQGAAIASHMIGR